MEGDLNPNEQEGIKKINGMYKEWFLDYASYVILERAIPAVNDGLKPVQRRILHSLKEMDDGRYNKVANVVGNTMKYHPHGDTAISDALVQLGQKNLLIDAQGNWGNTLTGDRAAASRYIEARLTKFALEIAFNGKTTNWQSSYDGRNKEPISLPVKFPLLLAQGVEGIAVGLSTKVLPHNFIELIDASISYLKGKKFTLFPDFETGGAIEIKDYKDGERGGRVRVRAKIIKQSDNTLIIKEIPFSTTTTSLMDSVVRANDKGKIKIKKIEDNTASEVEILIHLQSSTSPDKTIDALYAFTDCEISIAPNACVIVDDQPLFLSVSDILKINTQSTLDLLKKELEITLSELEEKWHFANLERIFIENKIYRDIEEEETWPGVISAIKKGLNPHIKDLKRDVTKEDIERLTEIRIKRISKFDLSKAGKDIEALEEGISETKDKLNDLVNYAIAYYKNLKLKYGKNRQRKTEIKPFEEIDISKVAAANVRFYVNRQEGFMGTSLKKDEFLFECSDLDDIIVFLKNGTMKVNKVETKTFIGKDILYVNIWKKKDSRTVYNYIYKDGNAGAVYKKRFSVTSITRDKLYDLTNGSDKSKVLYFSANPNGEAEVLDVFLRPKNKLKKLRFDLDFSEQDIKSRTAKGNILTKHAVKKIVLKEEGVSTLAPRKIWFDETVRRLNVDKRGQFLGEFSPTDKILSVNQRGEAKLLSFDLSNRFDEDSILIQKWIKDKPLTCVYFDGEKKMFYIKRFLLENSSAIQIFFQSENPNSYLELLFSDQNVKLELKWKDKKDKSVKTEQVIVSDFIGVKGIKAKGNQLSRNDVKEISMLVSPEQQADESEHLEGPTNQNDEPKEGTQGSMQF